MMCSYLPVGLLARSLGLSPECPWAMLASYFDESGTHDRSDVMVVAGLVSPVSQWDRLVASWERVLDKHNLPAFHTVDCAHGVNAFEGWSRAERSSLYKKLISLTTKHVLWRGWSAVLVPDYLQFFEGDENKENARKLMFSMCSLSCAVAIREISAGGGAAIPYMFERGGLGGGVAADLLDRLSSVAPIYRIGTVSFGTRHEVVQLQAADIHAYEIHKYFAEQLRPEPRSIRRSFKELLRISEAGGRGFGGFLYGSEKCDLWLKNVSARSRQWEIEPDPMNDEVCVTVARAGRD